MIPRVSPRTYPSRWQTRESSSAVSLRTKRERSVLRTAHFARNASRRAETAVAAAAQSRSRKSSHPRLAGGADGALRRDPLPREERSTDRTARCSCRKQKKALPTVTPCRLDRRIAAGSRLERQSWVDAVVTAWCLRLPDLQLAPRATIGPIRLRRGACALVASRREVGSGVGPSRSCWRGSGVKRPCRPRLCEQPASTRDAARARAWAAPQPSPASLRRAAPGGGWSDEVARRPPSRVRRGRWQPPVDSPVQVAAVRGAGRDVPARTTRRWCLRLFPTGSTPLRRCCSPRPPRASNPACRSGAQTGAVVDDVYAHLSAVGLGFHRYLSLPMKYGVVYKLAHE